MSTTKDQPDHYCDECGHIRTDPETHADEVHDGLFPGVENGTYKDFTDPRTIFNIPSR